MSTLDTDGASDDSDGDDGDEDNRRDHGNGDGACRDSSQGDESSDASGDDDDDDGVESPPPKKAKRAQAKLKSDDTLGSKRKDSKGSNGLGVQKEAGSGQLCFSFACCGLEPSASGSKCCLTYSRDR